MNIVYQIDENGRKVVDENFEYLFVDIEQVKSAARLWWEVMTTPEGE